MLSRSQWVRQSPKRSRRRCAKVVVEEWIEKLGDQRLRRRILELRQRYEFLSRNLFSEYQPTRRDSRRDQRDFMKRMEMWLEQFSTDNERLAAFQSIEYLFFAGVGEYDELYRCALQSIERWLLEINDLDPFESDKLVRGEVRRCWICPITDSLLINSFLHVTGISGQKYRPDWFSLSRFGRRGAIERYVRSNDLQCLVLLEDLVGSGKQASDVVDFAARLLDIPILVIPLIACAPGATNMRLRAKPYTHVSVRPIVTLPQNCLAAPTASDGEPPTFADLRPVMRSHYQRLRTKLNGREFGYGKVGSMVVTYSNCPNNTPPLYHRARRGETALFPRLPRPWR